MKLQIESTNFETTVGGTQCRMWKSQAEDGTELLVFVHSIVVPNEKFTYEFQQQCARELPTNTIQVPFQKLLQMVIPT